MHPKVNARYADQRREDADRQAAHPDPSRAEVWHQQREQDKPEHDRGGRVTRRERSVLDESDTSRAWRALSIDEQLAQAHARPEEQDGSHAQRERLQAAPPPRHRRAEQEHQRTHHGERAEPGDDGEDLESGGCSMVDREVTHTSVEADKRTAGQHRDHGGGKCHDGEHAGSGDSGDPARSPSHRSRVPSGSGQPRPHVAAVAWSPASGGGSV